MNQPPELPELPAAGLPARRAERGPARPAEREPGYGYAYEFAEEPLSGGLLEYFAILRRRKGTLILATFLGGLLAVLLTLPQTRIYQARTTLEIQSLNPDFMNLREVNPVEQASRSVDQADIQTQIQILKSENLVERTLKKLGWVKPAAKPDTDTSRPSAWRRALQLPGPGAERPARQRALDLAAEELEVRAQGQTRIVEVVVESTDPQVAAEFANTLAEEFIDQNLEARWATTQRTGEWLARQLEEMRVKLEQSEDELQAYARSAGLLYTREQYSIAEEKLQQIQAELSKAEADRIGKQSRYEMARTSPPEVLPDVLNDTALRDYQARITELRREEAELTTTFTREHPRVKRVRAQLAAMEAAFSGVRDAILGRIRNEYEEAVRREELLRKDYMKQARLVSGQAAKAIRYNILKREVDSNRQLYETMLERVKEASVASALRASNVRVVDRARAPERPSKPRPALNGTGGRARSSFRRVELTRS